MAETKREEPRVTQRNKRLAALYQNGGGYGNGVNPNAKETEKRGREFVRSAYNSLMYRRVPVWKKNPGKQRGNASRKGVVVGKGGPRGANQRKLEKLSP